MRVCVFALQARRSLAPLLQLWTVLLLAGCLGACNGDHPPRVAATPAAVRYSTEFAATENPLSEAGRWRRANNAWTHVRSISGMAFGTNGVSNGYDDSYALLSGFGPDQRAEGVIVRSAELVPNITHEVELLLRFTDGVGFARGYECLFAYFGGVQVVRWNGAIGDFTVLPMRAGALRLDRELRSGDRIRASITGTLIRLYINDELMAEATDATYATGQPGVGFFTRPGGNSAHLALRSYAASSN